MTQAQKSPIDCANNQQGFPVRLKGDMTDQQFLRHVHSERKILEIITSKRTESNFKRFIQKTLRGIVT